MRMLTFIALHVLLLIFTSSSRAQDWADLKGRFTFEDKIPKRKVLDVSERDKVAVGLPADHKILDESLVIDEKTRGIANIMIWIIPDPVKPDTVMPVHKSYNEVPLKEHVIHIKNLTYSPHVSIMRTEQKKVAFFSEQQIGHHPHINHPDVMQFSQIIPANARAEMPVKKQLNVPVIIHCANHPHETAYLLIRDNPYFAVTNEKGEFEIKHLPLGKWRFKVWQEKCGWIKEVTLAGQKTTWTKGELDVEIKQGGLDLGEIKISEDLFKNK